MKQDKSPEPTSPILTPEEINQDIDIACLEWDKTKRGRTERLSDFVVAFVVYAQAKKIVEWGRGNCTEHGWYKNGKRFACPACLEELEKEVGK